MQQDLFPAEPAPPVVLTGLFAEVVLDRPLEQVYTYAVGPELEASIGVGKRVRVPFGRGDKAIVGYCVGVTNTAPAGHRIKSVLAVLDEEALLSDHLLRLTRWMADYYLCGWGQALTAVVPAGAKSQAGTARRLFVEAVPRSKSVV